MKIIYCGISGKEKLISLDDVKECEERSFFTLVEQLIFLSFLIENKNHL